MYMQKNRWFTPDGIEDLLPLQAKKLERVRQTLLNELNLSGYDLVLPPIAEFTDSLLTGTGRKLSLDTCRFTDIESGRMMGVRADMTPQVARIVSNRIKSSESARLCYVGEVLKSRNNKAKGSRSPIQLGAELFGQKGIESDLEIMDLMLSCAGLLNLPNLQMSLGHVGVVQVLMNLAGFDKLQQNELVDILKRKAIPEYQAWLQQQDFDSNLHKAFEVLVTLCGEANQVMERAKRTLTGLDASLDLALNHIEQLLSYLWKTQQMNPHLDLADLRGFQYHTGVIFACYSVGETSVLVAKGGRYDGVCAAFGEDRPATGFSMDLRNLLDHIPDVSDGIRQVFAPFSDDPGLYDQIKQLRAQGVRVVRYNENSSLPTDAEVFSFQSGKWGLIVNKM